jgi:hypothetical protein
VPAGPRRNADHAMMIDASDLRQEIDRVIAERFGQMDQAAG